MEGTTTTLKIGEDGVVTLMRFGSVNTQFIFEQDKSICHIMTLSTVLLQWE